MEPILAIDAETGALTATEFRRVIILYTAATLPIITMLIMFALGQMRKWLLLLLISGFVLAAVGWEIWLTFGLLDGDPVDARRSAALSAAIPQNINWLINSLGDVGIIWAGVIMVSLFFGRSAKPFMTWHWGAFAILAIWFIGQNIGVEAFIYHEQLSGDARLSWAPFHPLGADLNPTLFMIGDRAVTLQAQTPWVIMTPVMYGVMIFCFRRFQNN